MVVEMVLVEFFSLPEFPQCICERVGSLSGITAQVAVVDIYLARDRPVLHQDISESGSAPLVSLYPNCRVLFIVVVGGGEGTLLRMMSGGAGILRGEARWA